MTSVAQKKNSAIYLIHCPDQMGLVAAVTKFLHRYQGNVLDLDQHVDRAAKHFFMRVVWDTTGFDLPLHQIHKTFMEEVGDRFDMTARLYFTDRPTRMAIFVSKQSHCLYDLLQRHLSGEWQVDIPLIISNHPDLQPVADRFNIPFHVFQITRENKRAQEEAELELLSEHQIDLVVLARYMQIVTEDFISHYRNRIINIHHSFLPAFVGAKPYHQAFERGVKIIGATSHYVTSDLDAGPIIAQQTVHVSHKDSVRDLVRKGRNLEKLVLSEAIWFHLQRKILPYLNQTIIF